ncbi:MAG: methyltransferase domain-containing protein [Chloroflexi bacterium]|nr:methyltransferase domain-containing protein [Chloroflexota bacterium]
MEIAGLLAMAVALALALDLVTYKATGYDLGAYVLGARRLIAREPLYPEGDFVLGPFGQFLYPPPVALLFVPLAPLSFDAARIVSLLVLSALAAFVTWTLARELRPRVRYWACAGIVLFFPLVWEISLGNLTLVTLALALAAWRIRNASWRGALALAGAAGLKLLAVPLLAFFAVARRPGLVARSMLVAAALSLATLPFLLDEWTAYVGTLAVIASAPPGTGSNIVPALFATPPLRPLLPLLALCLVLVSALAARRGGVAAEHAFRVALAATPLAASTLWYPYLVLAVPLLVAEAPAPDLARLRPAFTAARPAAWIVMQTQLVRDSGRDFILPLVGLLLLLGVGVLEVIFALRAARAVPPERIPRPAASGSPQEVAARACLLCRGDIGRPRFRVDGAAIGRCFGCGLVQQVDRPSRPVCLYDAAYYARDDPKGGYANYYLDSEINRRTFERRLRSIEARAARMGRLLDVGCSLGDLVIAADAAGWRAEGVEVAPFAASVARRRGAIVHVGDIRELDLGRGAYQAVTLYDTLEHVDDPVATLRVVRDLLAPGAVVHLVTPNVAGLQARLLGRWWYHYKRDEHLAYFSPSTLRRTVEASGLRWGGWAPTGSYVTISYVLNRLRRYAPRPFSVLDQVSRAVGLAAVFFYLHVGEMEAWAYRDA